VNQGSGTVNATLARLVTTLAACVAAALAITLPLAYYLSACATMHASLAAEAELASTSVTQLALNNPELWTFEEARIRGLLSLFARSAEPEQRLVFSADDRLIVAQGVSPAGVIMQAAGPIYDSGTIIGRVEVRRSQQPLLHNTAWVAISSVSLGALTFVILRVLPLRLLGRALARSEHLATHDVLTGLPNRALFCDRLDQSLAWSRREGASLSVLYIDLDRFKDVNDTLGHAAGDRLLAAVATRLGTCLRETDTLARLGGDEFAIVQVGTRHLADTERQAQRIVETLSEPFEIGGNSIAVGASIGITVRSGTNLALLPCDSGLLLQEADVALYRTKEAGRGGYCFFEAAMNVRVQERRTLECDIRDALENGGFYLHYQPQFDVRERRIVGAEALLRWQHPRRGTVNPEQFIPLAEQTGLIARVGEWVLHEACRQAAAWPDLACMAVNVSPAQFRRPGFVDLVQAALQQANLPPHRLEVEITEGVLLNETHETLAILLRLRKMGVTIAMDDFGTGYSSLAYLQKFRFDKIKIDRSFVCNLGRDPQADEIVRAVLRMSHAMGIRVIAEGVEEHTQIAVLREEGCEEMQGFLWGRPLAADEFADLLARQPWTMCLAG
jgi:diguanylate cyclase (GGDEF)-like protein